MLETNWAEVGELVDQIYQSTNALERHFPVRKLTLDGHLVSSVGEVVASYMFDLNLNAASTKGHDALCPDGRRVEIKLTQGKIVAIQHEPDHLLVLN